MLTLENNQLAELRHLDESAFVARMARQWPGYATDFPSTQRTLTHEQVESMAREAYRVADRHAFDEDMDRIRLTFYLWRATRLGKPKSYLQGIARFLCRHVPDTSGRAHDWMERQLYLAEKAISEHLHD